MRAKFKVGDKVIIKRLNKRTPLYISSTIRQDNKRTVTSLFYDPISGHNRYYLGMNYRGEGFLESYPFRAQELALYKAKGLGRPRKKRRYIIKAV